jgi:hypothetical protein
VPTGVGSQDVAFVAHAIVPRPTPHSCSVGNRANSPKDRSRRGGEKR